MFKSTPSLLSAAMLIVASVAASAADTGKISSEDQHMVKLASDSGCPICHDVGHARRSGPQGLPPIAPPWQEVAVRYKDKPGAVETLTRTVLEGSNPYNSHWKGQVSGFAMPPNATAISEANARRLVQWILHH